MQQGTVSSADRLSQGVRDSTAASTPPVTEPTMLRVAPGCPPPYPRALACTLTHALAHALPRKISLHPDLRHTSAPPCTESEREGI